jgi:hypothetical protein
MFSCIFCLLCVHTDAQDPGRDIASGATTGRIDSLLDASQRECSKLSTLAWPVHWAYSMAPTTMRWIFPRLVRD